MKTIEMALETGKLRREVIWTFVVMTAISLLAGGSLFRLVFVAFDALDYAAVGCCRCDPGTVPDVLPSSVACGPRR